MSDNKITTLPAKDLLRPDEVAKYFSVKRRTVYVWISIGKIKAIKIGKLLRIRRREVVKLQKKDL